MNTARHIQNPAESNELSDFFDQLIEDVSGSIRADQFMIETGVANKETSNLYSAIRNQDAVALMKQAHTFILKEQVRDLLIAYLRELNKRDKMPNKLALDLSEGKVLVWAEVNDDDTESEDALLLSEAMVNARFYGRGISISSFIVEKSDNFPIPNHYQQIPLTNA